jgi:hypothetical protein
VYFLRREVLCVESVWTLLFCTLPQESKVPSGNPKRRTRARFGSCNRSNFLPLTQPSSLRTLADVGREQETAILSAYLLRRYEYRIRPRVLSILSREDFRSARVSQGLFCASSPPQPFHLSIFGTFTCILTKPAIYYTDQISTAVWPDSSPQSRTRPSSQMNTMRSSWASRQSWILSLTSALFT